MKKVMPEDRLWYRRTFTLPEGFRKDKVLLHFGAVDQSCQVYVNGRLAGSHEGGYLPFSCDITAALAAGENTLTVAVTDATSRSRHAYGKQSFHPGGIWYTPQSGIWQTVWLESVPENYVEKLTITPDYDHRRVRFVLRAKDPEGANFVVRRDGTVIAVPGLAAASEFAALAAFSQESCCRALARASLPSGFWPGERGSGR